MALNYIVSAKKATAVSDAVVGNFTGEKDLNLIVARINRFTIYKVTTEGLKPVQEVPVFGRIIALKLFRAKNESKDTLVVLTAKFNLAILGWDSKLCAISPRATGSVLDRVGRFSEHGTILTVHQSGVIGIRIYEGVIKLIQWSDGKDLKCSNVRLEDLHIIDLVFLESPDDNYRVTYISNDADGRHLKTIELSLVDKEIKTVGKQFDFAIEINMQDNIDNEAFMLVPIPSPAGGVVVVAQETLMYYNWTENFFTSIPQPSITNPLHINCFAKIDSDGQRYLLGTDHGHLYMLILEIDRQNVRSMKLEFLGETSIPNNLVYLDNGVVFVGSRFGDSQLIRLTTEKHQDAAFVQVLETFVNLAPIRDMAVIETDGQTQLVTCSGYSKDGSLRVIRNGIGIEEYANVDLPGVKGVWSLHVDSELDNYIVISFSDESHILKIEGEQLEDTKLMELTTKESTLWAGCISGTNNVLQVTPSGMRLCNEKETKTWKPPNNNIDCVAVNSLTGQIAATSGCAIYYLECRTGDFECVSSKELLHEIACIDISSFERKKDSTMIAVGLWEAKSACIFALPDLKEIISESLPMDVLPRSVILTRMERTSYLIIALGDGSLFYYTLDTVSGALKDLKKTSLGTQPPSLHRFDSNGQTHIFACSDRPAVIFSSNNKLVFSNVNLKLLTQIGSLNSEKFRDCLVMSDGETLSIGTVDDIQKLHIRTVPLGESPKRIAFQRETGTYGVIVTRDDNFPSNGRIPISKSAPVMSNSNSLHRVQQEQSDGERHSLVILDQNTFEALHSHEFAPNEHAVSLISTRLGEDPTSPVYFIVGTAMVFSEETEAKIGRLIVFEVGTGEERTRLKKITEKEIKGAPYSMAVLGPKLVVAINSTVRLFEWHQYERPAPELRLECSHFNQISAINVKVKGDQILVGDLMRSMTILSYKNMENVFDEVSKDYRPMWMSSVEFIDAETVIGAESYHNLFTCEVDRNAQEEKQKLKNAGSFYLGELVNVFRCGSLVGGHVDSSLPIDKPILFGTAEGAIGLIVQLTEDHFKFLSNIEKAVAQETNNCMRVKHSNYRQFHSQQTVIATHGFIDGDLVEAVLEWSPEISAKILKGIHLPGEKSSEPEDVLKVIEDLSRIH